MGESSQPGDGAGQRPADDRYLPGEIIEGKYRLIRPLGQGGVGRVWVAHNLVLDVHVGLKVIYSDPEGAGTQGARLLQEARAAARLGHSAIVRVFDFGETRHGDPFVAMEMLHGETLAETLAREGRVPAIRAIQTMLPIADALSVAHGKGIVHRDIKPENIFIAHDEAGRLQPKLLDFGIARVDSNRKLTLQGTVLGTPDYMSPEQARGDNDVDERSDIWSFCVVLYELVTGATPFSGENYNALLYSIINDEPRPLAELAAGDTELWTLLQHGLRKAPKQRWESMRMLGEALALWLYERGAREDVCAASLKTSWLESGLSDVKIDVASSRPPESSQRVTPLSAHITADFESNEVSIASRPTQSPAFKRRRRALMGGAVLLALGIVGFVVGWSRQEPEALTDARQAPVAATLSAGRTPAMATPTVTPEPAAAAPAPADVGDASTTPAAPRKASKAVPRATGKPAPAKGKEYDFGF